jgi:tRNA pseudouridine55 synthase
VSRRHKRGRPVSGIVLLDKPTGVQSNAALQRVKWLYQARKAGHTGSLDNLASGLLPICLGEATKLSGYLLDASKCYLSRFTLGTTTTTGDAQGDALTRRAVPEFSDQTIQQAMASFRGQIEQIPPMYSAIKQNGTRLYELAYQGKEVVREPRSVNIEQFSLLERGEHWLDVEVSCSKGTYIRTLASDLGEALGCGAHVSMLRRTRVGPFGGEQMLDFDALERASERGLQDLDARLLEMDRAVAHCPAVEVERNSALYLRQGQAVLVPRAPTAGLVRLYSEHLGFMGIGEILDDGRVAPKRLLVSG